MFDYKTAYFIFHIMLLLVFADYESYSNIEKYQTVIFTCTCIRDRIESGLIK